MGKASITGFIGALGLVYILGGCANNQQVYTGSPLKRTLTGIPISVTYDCSTEKERKVTIVLDDSEYKRVIAVSKPTSVEKCLEIAALAQSASNTKEKVGLQATLESGWWRFNRMETQGYDLPRFGESW